MRKKTKTKKKLHKSRKKPVSFLARFFGGFSRMFAGGFTIW